MFSFFASQEKKMRANAANWIELADKVWAYRRDQLNEAERKDLLGRTDAVRQGCKDGTDAAKLKLLIESLEGTLRRVGGKIYPKTALIENVEFFLVAAIVIIGVRTYFVQPFKIPTNSMWPTYHGMTPEAYTDPEKAPGALAQVGRFLLFGAQRIAPVAPESGTISVQIGAAPVDKGGGSLYFQRVPGKSWLVFPTTYREYLFYVNQAPVRVQVPLDFDFDWAFRDALGVTAEQLATAAMKAQRNAGSGYRWVELERKAQQGKPFLAFDILTGDQLFVDRFSYHFFRPQVGQGFVFRTGNIPYIAETSGDQYYIKRLVGIPGDVIEIKNFGLYRNGQPITGAEAFDKNARRDGKYPGYRNVGSLSAGSTMTVPPRSYLPLGDNSANSADGRYWGFVPAKDAAGRPLFIYYPFTKRWGPAK
jgi:signal peptidase I